MALVRCCGCSFGEARAVPRALKWLGASLRSDDVPPSTSGAENEGKHASGTRRSEGKQDKPRKGPSTDDVSRAWPVRTGGTNVASLASRAPSGFSRTRA
eukprot:scaffold160323_cov27-Tisochrysis_lutea.AAC.2